MATLCLGRRSANITSYLSSPPNRPRPQCLKQLPRFLNICTAPDPPKAASFAFAFELNIPKLTLLKNAHIFAALTVSSSAPLNPSTALTAPSPASKPTGFPLFSSPTAAASQSENVCNSLATSSKFPLIHQCSCSLIPLLQSWRTVMASKI